MVWQRIRPEGFTWYATDFQLTSPTSIRLFVYDMADNYDGGIGALIHEQEITEFTIGEQVMLQDAVLRLQTQYAEEELERREKRHRDNVIVGIRKELFGE
jgi:hypothetical protein